MSWLALILLLALIWKSYQSASRRENAEWWEIRARLYAAQLGINVTTTKDICNATYPPWKGTA